MLAKLSEDEVLVEFFLADRGKYSIIENKAIFQGYYVTYQAIMIKQIAIRRPLVRRPKVK